ncbi:MAG: LptF/LptG family permease, partial [Pirellulaceae bacterium]|nr:LptF/LptG family permease [Pirellulaceae bacterium]
EAMRQGLDFFTVLKLLPFLLPNALRFAIPGTILFAACSVYGRLSASNEIVSLKSFGIHPWTIFMPTFVLAILLSFFTVWLNDLAVSWGRRQAQRVILQSVEQIAYAMLAKQRSYSTEQFAIHVEDVQGRDLIRPRLTIHGNGTAPVTTLVAAKARLVCNLEEDQLVIHLTDGELNSSKANIRFSETIPYPIPLSMASGTGQQMEKPSNTPMRDIPKIVEKYRQEQLTATKDNAAEATLAMFSGRFDQLTGYSWTQKNQPLKNATDRLHRLETEPWRRMANGFSCFFFVLVGAPLAVRLRNSDLWTSFALCFLPILLVYYPLLLFGVDRAKEGILPPYFVWVGNFVLLIWGAWLLRKTFRY